MAPEGYWSSKAWNTARCTGEYFILSNGFSLIKSLKKGIPDILYALQFRGGATMHGPKPRSHAIKLNKKVRRLGLKIALSARAAEGKASVVC